MAASDRWRRGFHPFPRGDFFPAEDGGCPLWNEPRVFSEWEAYIFLRMAATPKPRVWTLREKRTTITLEAGETRPLSVRYLMGRWGWGSKKRVTAFLARLAERSRIGYSQSTPDGDTYIIADTQFAPYGGDASPTGNGYTSGDTMGDRSGDNKKTVEKEKTSPPSGEKRAHARGSKFVPAEWHPRDEAKLRDIATERGADFDLEMEKMRDYEFARTYTDWDRVAANWMRNASPAQPGRSSLRPDTPPVYTPSPSYF